MSRRKKGARVVDPVALFRRRVALGAHLALEACVVAGSQGPWWDVFVNGERVMRHVGYDAGRAAPMEPLAAIAALAGIVAFFFASYDLVADADLQAPVLVASLVACVAAGALAHRVLVAEDTIKEIAEEVVRADVRRELRAGDAAPVATSGGAAGVAPVTTAAPGDDPMAALVRALPTVKPAWGMALLVAAAPLMVVVSVYLTFLTERASESS